ncbi:MAG: rRNA maturation RNase YbeY [candidate division WOR-3 bacterium]
MFNLNFFKTTKKKIPLKKKDKLNLEKILKREIKKENSEVKEINIVMVGRERIKRINKNFLGKNKKTDCISFNLGEIGEIYICSDFVKNKRDFLKLIIHSFYHIMGYDHKNNHERIKMEKKERKLLNKLI